MKADEQLLCLAGIAKCDNFLKNWDMRGNKKGDKKVCEYADKVSPQRVAETFKKFNRELEDAGADEEPDFCLVIFFANAKYGFIMRLVAIQERENAVSMA
jgi:hypothetical protein